MSLEGYANTGIPLRMRYLSLTSACYLAGVCVFHKRRRLEGLSEETDRVFALHGHPTQGYQAGELHATCFK